MSKADIEFKNLGYEKFTSSDNYLIYYVNYGEGSKIMFFTESKMIKSYMKVTSSRLLDVINAKSKEMGWLDGQNNH